MKQLKLLAFFTVWLIGSLIYAQSPSLKWAKTYNGTANYVDKVTAMAVDGAGNTYITGYSESLANGADYLTIKYNNTGDTLWTQRYDGPAHQSDQATAIKVDVSGNVFVTGKSKGINTGYDFCTIKYDQYGVQKWVSRYNDATTNLDENATAMDLDNTGNVYIVGYGIGQYTSNMDAFIIIKYNTDGMQQWLDVNTGANNYDSWSDYAERAYAAVIVNNNIFVTGESLSSVNASRILTCAYDISGGYLQASGYYIGTTSFGIGDYNHPTAITKDDAGNIYVCGVVDTIAGAGQNYNYIVLKHPYDFRNSWSDLLTTWTKTYDGPGKGDDVATAIKVDASFNVYVTGYSDGDASGTINNDYATLMYNSAGVKQWVKRYNSPANKDDKALALGIDILTYPHVYVVGTTMDAGGNTALTSIEYDFSGIQQWKTEYSATGSMDNAPSCLHIDGSGNLIASGYTFKTSNKEDYLTLRYCTNAPVAAVGATITSICQNESTQLTASGGTSYSWYPTSGLSDPNISNPTASPTVTNTYTVTVGKNGCQDAASIVIYVKTPPAAPTIYNSGTVCTGGSVTLSADSIANRSYHWTGPPNGYSLSYNSVFTINNITPTDTGTYRCYAWYNGCYSEAQKTVVNIYPVPSNTLTTSKPPYLCGGDSLVITAGVGTNYIWNNGKTTQSITAKTTGTYQVTITNSNGCSKIASKYILVYPAPTVAISSAKDTICQGESITCSITGSYSAVTWSTGDINVLETTTTPTATTTYIVAITDLNGCTASTQHVIVVHSLPQATVTASGATTFCQGDSVLLTANSASGYLWSNNATTQSITVKANGNYSVITSNSYGCTKASIPTTLTVKAKPSTPIVANSGRACEGDAVTLLASSSNGASYEWHGPNGYTSTDQNPIISGIVVSYAGKYSCIITIDGCTSDTAYTQVIVLKNNTLFQLKASGATTFCDGDSAELTVKVFTDTTGLTYRWSNNTHTQTIIVKTSGNYSAAVTDTNGCGIASMSPIYIKVTVHDLPTTPTITRNGNILTSSYNSGNQWFKNGTVMNGQTSKTLAVTSTGTYAVQQTDTNGCTSMSDTIKISSLVGIEELITGNSFTVLPNPFTETAQIQYELTNPSMVTLEVYNLLGEKIFTILEHEIQSKGLHIYKYAGTSNGVYFIKLKTNSEMRFVKVIQQNN